MLGRSHALSGVVVWVAGSAALSACGVDVLPLVVVAGAGVAAGAALLPDLDHPGSTVARSLGPVSRWAARGVSWLADWVRDRTCAHCATPDSGGHRLLTHTAVGCAGLGLAVAALCALAGGWAAAVVVYLLVGLAVRGLVRRRRRGTFGAAFAGAVAALLVVGLGPPGGWWWLGLPVAVGAFSHALGDALTRSGVPLWWPLRINGCRWLCVGTPRWMRFRTGSWQETWLVGGVLWVALAVSGLSLLV